VARHRLVLAPGRRCGLTWLPSGRDADEARPLLASACDCDHAVMLRIAEVRAEIAAACHAAHRDPAEVRLIAVTKQQDPAVLPLLAAAGQWDCGENRVEHLALMAAAAPAGVRFVYIGRVQGRQLARLVPHIAEMQSLCEPDHVPRLAQAVASQRPGWRLPVFLQVNTSGEPAKAGADPAAAPAVADAIRATTTLDLVGLMTMAPDLSEGASRDAVAACFGACRALALRLGLRRLSMGMSGDLDLAIAAGATEVRVGTRLFAAPAPA
jgi:PLP dependent protein